MRTTAIIAAGGVGERLGVAGGKQLLSVGGKPLAAWAIQACADARGVDSLVIACKPDGVARYEEALRAAVTTDKPLRFVAGGAARTASIAAALEHVSTDAEAILVQDGARPLVTPALIDAALDALRSAGGQVAGVIVGHPVSDTLKAARAGDAATGDAACAATPLPLIDATVEREGRWQVQTPQVFRAAALRDAYARAAASGQAATDDAGILEDAGYRLALLVGPRGNIKVTVAEDVELVEALLRAREQNGETRLQDGKTRIGLGYDVHALVEGRKLILGGVEIPFERGLDGHSDADVLTHAVADAVIGALRAGDLGEHFPDTDDQYRDMNSLLLLEQVAEMVRDQGWVIVDVDTVVIAQEPKLAPYRGQMRINLSETLGIAPECVGVKATTTERLGFAGRGEGIAAQAVVLLERYSYRNHG